MTYLQHLEELRRRIIVCVIALVLSFAVAWIFAWDILALAKRPAGTITIHYMGPMEPFIVRFKLALFGGFLLSMPVILFEILGFVTPALRSEEKKIAYAVLIMIIAFFCAGVAFGYWFIMPPAIRWLLGVAGNQMKPVLSAGQYVSFVGWFALGIGVSFETPIVIWTLVAMDVLTPEQLQKQWRMALIIILLVASIITPDWSPVTMIMVALPMMALYVISIALARITAKRKRKLLLAEETNL